MKTVKTENSEMNGEVQAAKMAYIPAQIHPHLDVIRHRSDGSILLGASQLTGRTWSGSLWHFNNMDTSSPDVEKCSAGVELDTGLNDVTLLSDNLIFLGLDTGMVQLWELKDDGATLSLLSQLQTHDSFVTSVSAFGNGSQKAVSGSQDRSIKLLDLEEMVCLRSCTAHFDGVTSVACHPTEPEIFLSCGTDGRLLLWDMRKPKPARMLDTHLLDGKPSSVAWQPESRTRFAVGTDSGQIYLMDHGTSSSTPTTTNIPAHSRTVHRLAFNNKNPNWLASASDDCTSIVADMSSFSVGWKFSDHIDFVRGVSWDPSCDNKLVTCGWDFQVLKHTVTEEGRIATVKVEDMDTLSPNHD